MDAKPVARPRGCCRAHREKLDGYFLAWNDVQVRDVAVLEAARPIVLKGLSHSAHRLKGVVRIEEYPRRAVVDEVRVGVEVGPVS